MEPIVKPLSNDLLESWGFKYDGYNWVHPNYPFTLMKDISGEGYKPMIKDAPIGQQPPKLETNSNLLQLITSVSGPWIQERIKDSKVIGMQAQSELLAKLFSEFFSFDPGIAFKMQMNQMGQGAISPGNEYTLTLLSGVQCQFTVEYIPKGEFEGKIAELYYHPQCISNEFLIKTLNADSISAVYVLNDGDTEVPFFGIGFN